MLLTCPGCHHTFKHFARENTDKVKCFCGTEVPVDNVTRFEFTCKQCGKLSYWWILLAAIARRKKSKWIGFVDF